MLLEIKVLGSAQWYEQAMPQLEQGGFVLQEDLGWADPETDGEYMGYYYDYQGQQPLRFEELVALIKKIKTMIRRGEAPLIEVSVVADKE